MASGGFDVEEPGGEPSTQPPRLSLDVSLVRPAAAPADILERMTEGHLTQVLDQSEKEGARHHRERILQHSLVAAAVVLALVTILLLCWMFLAYGKPELLDKIIALIAGLVAGGIGGFGAGRVTAPKDEE